MYNVVDTGWGSSDKILLMDVDVVTLHHGRMTNSRRTHPVPQLKCVGGSAGCSAFTLSVVQCYNHGTDGIDVQVKYILYSHNFVCLIIVIRAIASNR